MCDHLGRHDASAANDGDSEQATVGNGHSCTIVGTSGDDRGGGDGPAGAADNGADTVYGGPGNDVLDGGNGDDVRTMSSRREVMSSLSMALARWRLTVWRDR